MLLIYLDLFNDSQIKLLTLWSPRVNYWPRSTPDPELFSDTQITDWWILFSHAGQADIWLLRWPEHTRVCRTLFD
jgi:hypothetical protein